MRFTPCLRTSFETLRHPNALLTPQPAPVHVAGARRLPRPTMPTTLSVLLLLFAPCHALLAGVQTPGRVLPRFGPKMAVLPPYNSGITPIEIQIIQRQFASVRELPRVSQSFKSNETDNTVHDEKWWWGRTAWSKCPLGSAPAQFLCLLRARLAALGSSRLPGRGRPTGCPATVSAA